MSPFLRKIILPAALGLGLTRAGFACDACAIYMVENAGHPGFSLTAAQQFTRFGTVWSGDQRFGNPADQYLDSSITQLTVGYTRGGPWRLQFTAPLLSRSFRRPEAGDIETGRESGWGDATLAGHYEIWRRETDTGEFSLGLLGGIKFATGNATHLGDELAEEEAPPAGNFPESGIHGHDLARGSGSFDYLAGADMQWREGRVFVRGSLQYKLRRPGAFDYRLADEVSWEAGPGAYLILSPERSLAVQALFSTEHKGLDTLAGEAQADTGFSARYLGGRITGTLGEHFVGEASAEIPVRRRTTALMVVPDYRLRAAVTWRF